MSVSTDCLEQEEHLKRLANITLNAFRVKLSSRLPNRLSEPAVQNLNKSLGYSVAPFLYHHVPSSPAAFLQLTSYQVMHWYQNHIQVMQFPNQTQVLQPTKSDPGHATTQKLFHAGDLLACVTHKGNIMYSC